VPRIDCLDLYRLLATGRRLGAEFMSWSPGWHSTEGEEAVVVGAFAGLRATDYIAPHYRGAELASFVRGVPLRDIMTNILGKASGFSRGRVRGEICGPPSHRIIGMYTGVLGPQITYAAGAALAIKLRGEDDVVICTFGDGTANRGDIHEALAMSAMLSLPIVFVCQNNGYAVSTRAEHALNRASIAERARGYNIIGERIDGMDVDVVLRSVSGAVAHARAGLGPTLIEACAMRLGGHFASDDERYRDPAEAAMWREKDPLAILERRLLADGRATAETLAAIRSSVDEQVRQARREAESEPEPGSEDLGAGCVYA
jgi:TPP-dependent pyruvate/acetoin dehydrogenase alpha subunit